MLAANDNSDDRQGVLGDVEDAGSSAAGSSAAGRSELPLAY